MSSQLTSRRGLFYIEIFPEITYTNLLFLESDN